MKHFKFFAGGKPNIRRFGAGLSVVALFTFFLTSHAYATVGVTDVNGIVGNATESVALLPWLISSMVYLLGIMLGILGVLKLREHAENPSQVPLKVGVIRLLVGGAMFAMPAVFTAAYNTIGGSEFDLSSQTLVESISGILGDISKYVQINVNSILQNLSSGTSAIPGLITVISYLLGLIITVVGVLKIKDHVENPEQTRLKESVVRLLAGGALLAMPTIYNAMFGTIQGTGLNTASTVNSGLGALDFVRSGYAGESCDGFASTFVSLAGSITGAIDTVTGWIPGVGGTNLSESVPQLSMGNLICGLVVSTGYIPAFLSGVAYILGLILGVWGVLKLRDHVLDPQRTNLYEGVSRLLAGGAFFALPFLIEVLRNTVGGGDLLGALYKAGPVTGYNAVAAGCGEGGGTNTWQAALDIGAGILDAVGLGGNDEEEAAAGGGVGLDCMLANFMRDVMAPVHVVLNFFTFVAGMVFLMIGISRLIKSAQDGARGPGGMGTIMTFVIAGALISYNELMRAVSASLFAGNKTATFAKLQYAEGALNEAESASAEMIISAILKFVILVGLISFVRGLFIIRSLSEGNQQASLMAGLTHIIAGAVAVNLGPLINAVQATLGIANFGISFQ